DAALQLATTQLKRVRDEIGKIIVGQQDVVDGVLICLLGAGTYCWRAFRAWARPRCCARWRACCT
ncbi:MAG TPA: hypothetical protein VKU60_08850, partial [Chloroflexota bacterium]|nr:hypothetical protein [Chloroflexota bacterium]